MNAIPAEAQTEAGQETQGQHLAVVGGKGKPSKEALEARRAETRDKLETWGLFKAARDRRAKAFDSWSIADCDSAIAWAQKQIQKNGELPKSLELEAGMMCDSCGVESAKHFMAGSPDPAEGMCLCDGCYWAATMIPETMGPEGEGPWVDEQIVTKIFHDEACAWGVWIGWGTLQDEDDPDMSISYFVPGIWPALEIARTWDGFRGVTGTIATLSKRLAEALAEVDELKRELAESFDDIKRLNDIKRLAENPGYDATLDQLYIVMSIDNGKAVRDIAHAVQGIIFDAKRRDCIGYKGEASAKLCITFDKDKTPGQSDVAIITCEVSQKTPAAVCGSRIGLDTSGKVVAPREFFQNLPLGRAS